MSSSESDEKYVIVAPVRPKFFISGSCKRNRQRVDLCEFVDAQDHFLRKFRKYAKHNQWKRIHELHYDWYLFPLDDGSKPQWRIGYEDMVELRNSPRWLERYHDCVTMVAQAWGWDVVNACAIDLPTAKWTNWDVRLAKIIRSLWLFEEKTFMESMQKFARVIKPEGGLSYGKKRKVKMAGQAMEK